jgi:hypothetical protein
MAILVTAAQVVDAVTGRLGIKPGGTDSQINFESLKDWMNVLADLCVVLCPTEYLDDNIGYGISSGSLNNEYRFVPPTNLSRFLTMWSGSPGSSDFQRYEPESSLDEIMSCLAKGIRQYKYCKMGSSWVLFTPLCNSSSTAFFKFFYITRHNEIVYSTDYVSGKPNTCPNKMLPVLYDLLTAIAAGQQQRPDLVPLYQGSGLTFLKYLHSSASGKPPKEGATDADITRVKQAIGG